MATSGQTTDPKTGKVFRLQPPKQRSPEFIRLSAEAEAARVALVTYCNSKGYAFDLKSGRTVRPADDNGKRVARPVSQDRELDGLVSSQQAKKQALKKYKTSHPEEFRAQAPGKTSGKPKTVTMTVINKPDTSG